VSSSSSPSVGHVIEFSLPVLQPAFELLDIVVVLFDPLADAVGVVVASRVRQTFLIRFAVDLRFVDHRFDLLDLGEDLTPAVFLAAAPKFVERAAKALPEAVVMIAAG
jgi:hypothetical protein